MSGGWGSGSWGLSPWGSGQNAPRLLSASAIRENLVRLTFDTAILYDRTGSPRDGSRRQLYAVNPLAGTASYDGEEARAVIVGRVDQGGGAGTLLDLWLDRPLTGYPARYSAIAASVYGTSGLAVDPAYTSTPFDGARAGRVSRSPTDGSSVIGADLALPQTESAALLARASGAILGAYAVDSTGDFAFDAGLQSLVKRILRRLFTRPGSFSHLPGYGMGLVDKCKRLMVASERAKLSEEAARNARAEPEVADASATFRSSASGAWELRLKVKTRIGQELDLPTIQLPTT